MNSQVSDELAPAIDSESLMTERDPRSTIIFGFDSAWKNKNPGAICAITFDKRGNADFIPPELVSFEEALHFIETKRCGYAASLIAIDQPTIIPNENGMRPVEKVAGSLVSFIGGGVQPANRSKLGMFCNDAPIWKFLCTLGAKQTPLKARSATKGHFLIEVFPALALPALNPCFAKRRSAPKYNPVNRRKFQIQDWKTVAQTIAVHAKEMGIAKLAHSAEAAASCQEPSKKDQDKLDASLCALIGLIWRGGSPDASAMIGDTDTGYMITPISGDTIDRLKAAADKRKVSFQKAM